MSSAVIRSLIQEQADVNGRHADGATALHWAAHWDELETARLLIRAGALANVANDLGVTPLSLACTNGSAAMADVLMAAGADPNLALASGETPLMTAARTGRVGLVDALLARGADLHARRNQFRSVGPDVGDLPSSTSTSSGSWSSVERTCVAVRRAGSRR